ncbi:phosphoribosylglycinamide formyltransferase [Flavobacterium saliperosum S13]|uniref:Phosphoribosylglycinamide formyltransferase n=2 Tax=Flavobacterium saliperosum TaxID=329186 RepID=A0A1G4W7Q7_9FLAO|nr:phosphoribosylglycinamide formyltransferase [Flavobacterium saliperosum]ESU23022.1 phosphoribosylglycinamide formyltransferase [Flavobacterium saliperosum S13]SCX17686.1 formyltetrahydrofolate-dependent phosphoribosylglycinamide formyltransferase [Flavobacterium saliperosum]
MKRIVIFASGSGSNAENIILHFKNKSQGNVIAVLSNNLHAKVLDRAKNHDIPVVVFNKTELSDGTVLEKLNELQPDLIVLAGFLLMFPAAIIAQYPDKIINVHPALLPKYGGKGMYGMKVHQAVLENKEKETGISIHYVNEHYDEGAIIFQSTVNVEDCTTPEEIAAKVHELEHRHFPEVIEKLISQK